jgi:UDP-glucose-4-epimerase GalE
MSLNVLVAGGAGYIGSHACKALAAAGHRPVVLDNLSHGHRWAVRWGPLIVGDIADRACVRNTITENRIDAIMDFAAFIFVGESMQEPAKYFANNVGGTAVLLDEAVRAGITRFVFSSTAAVYGDPVATPIREDHPLNPVNAYGESKRMVERMLAWSAERQGLRYACLRYFNAAGADLAGEVGEAHDPETHLVPLAILAALGRAPALKLFGEDYPTPDGTAVRDYIHASDLADAHVRALDHIAGGGNLIANLGSGRGYSVREVIAAVERIGERPVPLQRVGRRPGDAPSLVADPSRAHALLDWQPQHSELETIVATAWRWHANR